MSLPTGYGLTDTLKALSFGQDLDAASAEAAVAEILEGRATEPVIAAFLTALRVKGETASELTGAVAAVRARVSIEGLDLAPPGAVDTCGTGGDCANTVNVSTAAAILVAACGVPVVKHGNRSASGNSGSAEVLAELGVTVEAPNPILSRCLREAGITFLFAPKFHPGLRFAGPVRRQLPFRTLFNLVGPLANPARPDHQLVGVAGLAQAELVAGALANLRSCRAAVVSGSDGLDEVTLAGPTHVFWVENGAVTRRTWTPESFGLPYSDAERLRVSGPADSAARLTWMLDGERGPVRDSVVANAAASLMVAGRCPDDDPREGVRLAADAIDSGRARELLARWAELSRGEDYRAEFRSL